MNKTQKKKKVKEGIILVIAATFGLFLFAFLGGQKMLNAPNDFINYFGVVVLMVLTFCNVYGAFLVVKHYQ